MTPHQIELERVILRAIEEGFYCTTSDAQAMLEARDLGLKAKPRKRKPAAHAGSEDSPAYLAHRTAPTVGDNLIAEALALLTSRLRAPGAVVDSPQALRDLARLSLGDLEHEVFCVAFLNAQHALIEWRELFRGTLTQTSVYPREVVKEALRLNAAAVVLCHNHPSQDPKPSRADELLTRELQATLKMIDVNVLDHLIVAGTKTTSFAERGLL